MSRSHYVLTRARRLLLAVTPLSVLTRARPRLQVWSAFLRLRLGSALGFSFSFGTLEAEGAANATESAAVAAARLGEWGGGDGLRLQWRADTEAATAAADASAAVAAAGDTQVAAATSTTEEVASMAAAAAAAAAVGNVSLTVVYNMETREQSLIHGMHAGMAVEKGATPQDSEEITALAITPNRRFIGVAERCADRGVVNIYDAQSYRRRRVLKGEAAVGGVQDGGSGGGGRRGGRRRGSAPRKVGVAQRGRAVAFPGEGCVSERRRHPTLFSFFLFF